MVHLVQKGLNMHNVMQMVLVTRLSAVKKQGLVVYRMGWYHQPGMIISELMTDFFLVIQVYGMKNIRVNN